MNQDFYLIEVDFRFVSFEDDTVSSMYYTDFSNGYPFASYEKAVEICNVITEVTKIQHYVGKIEFQKEKTWKETIKSKDGIFIIILSTIMWLALAWFMVYYAEEPIISSSLFLLIFVGLFAGWKLFREKTNGTYLNEFSYYKIAPSGDKIEYVSYVELY